MSIGSKNFDKIQNLDQLNQEIKSEIEYRKKLKELKKKDPFIYH